MPSCVVKLCKNNSTINKKDTGITYHQFPADPVICDCWTAKIRLSRQESWWKPGKSSVAPSPSLRLDESLIQALSVLPRKANPVKIIYNNNNNHNTHHNSNAPPEVLQTFMDILRQFNSSDKSPPSEPNLEANKSPNTCNHTINGSNQHSTRQDIPVTVSSSNYPPPHGAGGIHGVATPPMFAPHVAPAPPPFQPYQPMPPTGLYYPPPYAGPPTGMQMGPDSQAMRAHAPVAMPPAPPPLHQPRHYAIGRYPPPYYPRHQ